MCWVQARFREKGVRVSDGGSAPASVDRIAAAWAQHSAAVLAYAARRVPVAEDAADVLAETYLVAWRRIGQMPVEPNTRPWLFTVARNVLANQHRASVRRSALTQLLIEDAACMVADHQRPPGVDSTADGVARALALLSEADREVLLLAGWDELTPAQIATVQGCSAAAARVRLHRARRRLRALLDSEDCPHERTDTTAAPRSTRTLEVPR